MPDSHAHTGEVAAAAATHAGLPDVTPDQHHPQAHAIGGADHSGSLAHTALGSVLPDQHHPQVHAIGGTDHSGSLAHTALGSVLPDQHHAQSHSIIGGDHSGFPGGTSTFLRADATFAAPPGGSGGLVLSEVEVNLGGPRRSGRFTIAGVGMTVGAPVLVVKAAGPYTGKGTRADEAEMDLVVATGHVRTATEIEVFWQSASWVKGNHIFNYSLGG